MNCISGMVRNWQISKLATWSRRFCYGVRKASTKLAATASFDLATGRNLSKVSGAKLDNYLTRWAQPLCQMAISDRQYSWETKKIQKLPVCEIASLWSFGISCFSYLNFLRIFQRAVSNLIFSSHAWRRNSAAIQEIFNYKILLFKNVKKLESWFSSKNVFGIK